MCNIGAGEGWLRPPSIPRRSALRRLFAGGARAPSDPCNGNVLMGDRRTVTCGRPRIAGRARRLADQGRGRWRVAVGCCSGRPWRVRGRGPPRHAEVERERTRELARIGANLNQIARWANTFKANAEAVEIVAHLVAIERALAALAPVGSPDPDAH